MTPLVQVQPGLAAWPQTKALVQACAALRPGPLTSPIAATKASLRTLTRRRPQLQAELTRHHAELQDLVSAVAPTLVALPGVDPAGQLLVTAGDNPSGGGVRLPWRIWAASPRSRPPRAAPIATGSIARRPPANHGLGRIALVRLRCHPPTRA
jgi:transposase